MNVGNLNQRNDELFNKLDSTSRKDVNRLIQLQKETSTNSIGKQIRDSLEAIEENLFKLDSFDVDSSKLYETGIKSEEKKQKQEKEIFSSIVDNLSLDNDGFLKKIETLYNILFKSYKSELIIRNDLNYSSVSFNDADEYVKNRILGRIIFNIEYFRNFTKEYEKYDFDDVIKKIKEIPEKSMPQEQHKIREKVNALLDKTSDTDYTGAADELIILITGDIKRGGGSKSFYGGNTPKFVFKDFGKKFYHSDNTNTKQYISDLESKYINPPTNSDKHFIILVGKPGAGKSYFIENNLEKVFGISVDNFINLNPDDLRYYNKDFIEEISGKLSKEKLNKGKEYNVNGKLLTLYANNSGNIEANEHATLNTLNYIRNSMQNIVLPYFIKINKNIIYDTACSDASYCIDLVKKFVAKGFKPSIICVDAPNELARKRAKEREKNDGRFMSNDYLNSIYNNFDIATTKTAIINTIGRDNFHKIIDFNNNSQQLKSAEVTANITSPPTDSHNLKKSKDICKFVLEIKYKKRFNAITNDKNKKLIRKIIIFIIYELLNLRKTVKRGSGGSEPTNSEETTDSNELEYARRAAENAFLILTKKPDITEVDLIQIIIKLLVANSYISKNLENKVNFFVLEVFYGIIYGTLLSYDLRLKEENKYIIERIENISEVYRTINDIIYDQTYRTLKQLYIKRNPGHLNIFKVDSLYNDVFTSVGTNIPKLDTFATEKEYNLRDLVILKIINGSVDIKDFKSKLKIMYEKTKYQSMYEYLHNLSDIINSCNELIIVNDIDEDTGDKIKKDLETKINKLIEATEDFYSELNKEKATATATATSTATAPATTPTTATATEPKNTKETLQTLKTELESLTTEKLKEVEKLKKDLKKKIEENIKSKEEENIGANNGKPEGSEDSKDKDDLQREILKILSLDKSSEENKTYSALFEKYLNANKKIGGFSEIHIQPINIETPVSKDTDDTAVCHNSIENMAKIIPVMIGGDDDYKKIERKREELKAKLENPAIDDDITESVSDNAKRRLNKVKNNIKQFFNTKENVETDIPKVLDEEYLENLKEYNINDIKKHSYTELRKKLYRIKSSEYFEDIKITNEDIYTFIATTYVLRVISLYISMWFIQIEIVKDVESVIVAYILTYILLFVLIYTFVNLSDNQLDTSKSFLYYFYSRVNFSYTRFIVHLGLLLLLIIIPFVIRTIDKESGSYKYISETEKRYLYTFITNMSTIVWVILSIIAFFFK